MKLGSLKCRKVTEPDFSKKFSFSQNLGKWAQIGPKSDFFALFSKSAPTFFLIFWIFLEGNSALILPKTACSGKFWFRSYGPKSSKNYLFSKAYISGTSRANPNLFWFSESSKPCLSKIWWAEFRYLHSFTPKIELKVPVPKRSQKWFFHFLKFGWSDFVQITQTVRY